MMGFITHPRRGDARDARGDSSRAPRVLVHSLTSIVLACGLTLGFASSSLAADPGNVTPPSISPTGAVGEGTVLTLTPGTWDATVTDPPTDVWSDCTPANVCTTSTGSSYTIPADEPADSIFVTETATDAGTSSTASVSSNVVTADEPPVNTVAPGTPGGTPAQGQTLTADHGTWTNNPTYSYVWQDCSGGTCTASPSSTNSASYTVTAADVAGGSTIRVEVTATNASGSATADSPETGPATGAPASTGALPTITGTAAGGTLTEGHGDWTNDPTGYAYQWLSCTGSSASTCSAISGANAQTYAVPAASDGLAYEVQETASNISGSGAPATSTVLIPPPPVNTGLPGVTGTVALGQTLTASAGSWNNGPTSFAYQWQRCSGSPLACTAISGATATTYTLTSADAGSTIAVQVTATNAGGSASTSSAGDALTPAPVPRNSPAIDGTAQEGDTLTETSVQWVNSPTTVTRQWYLCDSSTNNCAAISGATGQTFVPTAADVGGTLQVIETATNAGGSASIFSQFTDPVLNAVGVTPVPVADSPPTISGTVRQGETLREAHGDWSENPGDFSYQWLRCSSTCLPISGATGQTYALGAGDVGFSIKVQESAANKGGSGNPAVSSATGAVSATTATGLVAPALVVTDQQLTLIATVTSGSGNAPATGTVSFQTASGPIAGCGAVAARAGGQTATATCVTSFTAGSVAATAVFSPAGGSLLNGSSSPVSMIAVGKARTVVHLSAPGQVAVGSRVKFTATVAPKSSPARPLVPAGTVTFMDHGKTIHGCSKRRLVKAGASCQVKYTALGAHRITVHYGGNTYFSAATSSVGKVTAGKQGPNYVTSVMQWYVHYSPTYTRFTSWQAYGVAPGSSFFFTCSGKGCPFAKRTMAVANSSSCKAKGRKPTCPSSQTVDLEPVFGAAKLHVGTTVTISILRCGWYGKHYTLKIRPGRGPSSVISTTPVGRTQPGLKC